MNELFSLMLKLLPARTVFAHCDIPCGIYDPHNLQMAAHTVIRMTSLINDLETSSDNPDFKERKKIISQVTRLTKVKEEHAETLKHELRILWADYFKEEHLKDYPDLHKLVFETMKLASKVRQNIDLEACQKLLVNTQEIAEIFYKTKGLEVIKIPSGYPTEGELVSHK